MVRPVTNLQTALVFSEVRYFLVFLGRRRWNWGGNKKKINILCSRYISYKEGTKKEGKNAEFLFDGFNFSLYLSFFCVMRPTVLLQTLLQTFVTQQQAKVVHFLLHPKLLDCPNKAPSVGCWQYFCPRFGSGAIGLRCWAWSCTCISQQQQAPSAFCLVSRGYITNVLQSGLMTSREQQVTLGLVVSFP